MKIPLIWLKDYLDIDKSPQEIGDSFTRIGLMLDKPVGEDNVLDLEQRLNRSDLLSILGCARDLSVFENLKLIEPKIKLHKSLPATAASKITITIDTPSVNRFNTRVFRGIKVAPSPEWLKTRLGLYGIENINNIVDITNFVMLEFGQTMHAQDTDKFPIKEIVARPAVSGEKITTLLGTEITLNEKAFVLASGGRPMVIGGIVGGVETGVTNKTVNIVLDAGNYDPQSVRQASRSLKITNESVLRNDKLLDPRLTEFALNRATDLILELAGGTYYANEDYYPNPGVPQSLTLTWQRLHLIYGQEIAPNHAKSILQSLGYIITEETEDQITVEVPYFRTDLEVEDDLVSDILRMSDYNLIPLAPLITPIPPDITPDLYRFEEKLRDDLLSMGAHEHITTQLVQDDSHPDRIVLENALSEDQNALRMSANETLPTVQTTYKKHKINSVPIFEIGKSFVKPNMLEIRELVVLDSQDIRATLATLMHRLSLANFRVQEAAGSVDILIGTDKIGELIQSSFTLYTPELIKHASPYPRLVSQFGQSDSIDLSISLPPGVKFDIVQQTFRAISPDLHMISVIEEFEDWKLVRLSWQQKVKDLNQIRLKLIDSLTKLNIKTRSAS